jgi:hypothetical protein
MSDLAPLTRKRCAFPTSPPVGGRGEEATVPSIPLPPTGGEVGLRRKPGEGGAA